MLDATLARGVFRVIQPKSSVLSRESPDKDFGLVLHRPIESTAVTGN